MTTFWGWWIAGLVSANILFALWLLYGSSRQDKTEAHTALETTHHTWDGDLQEYNNPLPRWWLIGFYLSVAFAVGYLILYPGWGAFRGVLGWSEVSQWRAQNNDANALSERQFARFDNLSLQELAADPDALKVGRNLFAANCIACHGSDARGAKGFPDLTSRHLTWGDEPEALVATVSHGRDGVMPTWQAILSPAEIDAVSSYLYSLSGNDVPPNAIAQGKIVFSTYCAACHGLNGQGNTVLGAPDLTDTVWIYGGSLDDIRQTVRNGRTNHMPAQVERLGERQVKLLTAYVVHLRQSSSASDSAITPRSPQP